MSVIFCIIFYCEKDSGDLLIHHGSNEKWIYYIAAYPNPDIVAELYSFNVTPNIFLSLPINTDSSYYIDTLHAVKPQLAFIFQSELYYLPALWSCIHTSLIHCHDQPCHSHSHTVL